MIILDMVLEKITDNLYSKSSEVLAGALLSACGVNCPSFNLLSVSTKLDQDNKALVVHLMNISLQPDFCNSDQDKAVDKIRELLPKLG